MNVNGKKLKLKCEYFIHNNIDVSGDKIAHKNIFINFFNELFDVLIVNTK